MVFCNNVFLKAKKLQAQVTILILIDGFLQYGYIGLTKAERKVTILILIDGFLQSQKHTTGKCIAVMSQSLF